MSIPNTILAIHRRLGIKYRIDRWRLYVKRFGLQQAIAISRRLAQMGMIHQVAVPGLAHDLAVRGGTADAPTFEKIFLWNDYDLDYPMEVEFIIDAGANIGLSAVFFASRFPTAQIIAIEPQRDNFELLRRNISPYPGIIPLQAALWGEDTTVGLSNPGERVDSYRFDTVSCEQAVPAITIPSLLDKFGFDRIDLLKMDIEGAEVSVFSDRPWWVDRVGMFIVELHSDAAAANFLEATCRLDAIRYRHGENHIVIKRTHQRLTKTSKLASF